MTNTQEELALDLAKRKLDALHKMTARLDKDHYAIERYNKAIRRTEVHIVRLTAKLTSSL